MYITLESQMAPLSKKSIRPTSAKRWLEELVNELGGAHLDTCLAMPTTSNASAAAVT